MRFKGKSSRDGNMGVTLSRWKSETDKNNQLGDDSRQKPTIFPMFKTIAPSKKEKNY